MTTTRVTARTPLHHGRPLGVLLALMAAGVVLAGCGGGGGSPSSSSAASTGSPGAVAGKPPVGGGASSAGSMPGAAGATVGQAVAPAAPQILRTAQVTLSVRRDHLQGSFAAVTALATREGGFVSSSDAGPATGSNPTDNAVLRVPSDKTAETLTALDQVGRSLRTRVQGQDVTGQVNDLGTRVKNLGAEETALRVLAAKAASVSDLLAVQQQLFSVRGQIDQLVQQQSSLTGQVSYATFDVTLTTPPVPAASRPRLWSHSLHLAADHSVAVLRFVVVGVGWSFPALVAAALAGGAYLLLRRAHRSGRAGIGGA